MQHVPGVSVNLQIFREVKSLIKKRTAVVRCKFLLARALCWFIPRGWAGKQFAKVKSDGLDRLQAAATLLFKGKGDRRSVTPSQKRYTESSEVVVDR